MSYNIESEKFAIVVGNEVAGSVSIEVGYSEATDRIIAAYKSDPKIIPIETDSQVTFGWTWDGTNFIEPSN